MGIRNFERLRSPFRCWHRLGTVTHSAMLRGRASSWLSVEHIRRVVRVGIVPLRNAVIEVAINQIVLN
jgi:hypothetical protein